MRGDYSDAKSTVARPRLPRACDAARRQLVAAAADGSSLPPACSHHLERCPACQRFAENLSAVQLALAQSAPAVQRDVADLAPVPHSPWKSLLPLAAAAAVVVAIGLTVALSGLLRPRPARPWPQDVRVAAQPELPHAADVPAPILPECQRPQPGVHPPTRSSVQPPGPTPAMRHPAPHPPRRQLVSPRPRLASRPQSSRRPTAGPHRPAITQSAGPGPTAETRSLALPPAPGLIAAVPLPEASFEQPTEGIFVHQEDGSVFTTVVLSDRSEPQTAPVAWVEQSPDGTFVSNVVLAAPPEGEFEPLEQW